jgi:hypothetical protein
VWPGWVSIEMKAGERPHLDAIVAAADRVRQVYG